MTTPSSSSSTCATIRRRTTTSRCPLVRPVLRRSASSYSSAGGGRAVEHLRLVAGELQMADGQQVALSLITHRLEHRSLAAARGAGRGLTQAKRGSA